MLILLAASLHAGSVYTAYANSRHLFKGNFRILDLILLNSLFSSTLSIGVFCLQPFTNASYFYSRYIYISYIFQG